MYSNKKSFTAILVSILLIQSILSGFGTALASSVSTQLGDINADGKIDSSDYSLLKRYILAGPSKITIDNILWAGDLNGDKSVNSYDASIMCKYLSGVIDLFPAQLDSSKANEGVYFPSVDNQINTLYRYPDHMISPIPAYTTYGTHGNNTITENLEYGNRVYHTKKESGSSGPYFQLVTSGVNTVELQTNVPKNRWASIWLYADGMTGQPTYVNQFRLIFDDNSKMTVKEAINEGVISPLCLIHSYWEDHAWVNWSALYDGTQTDEKNFPKGFILLKCLKKELKGVEFYTNTSWDTSYDGVGVYSYPDMFLSLNPISISTPIPVTPTPVPTPVPTPISTPSPINVGVNILNDHFNDADADNWVLSTTNTAVAFASNENGEKKVHITNSGNSRWDVALIHSLPQLKLGVKYKVEFKARSLKDTSIYAKIGDSGDPFYEVWNNNYVPIELLAGKEVSISQTFVIWNESQGRDFTFHMGGNLAKELPNDVYLDDIVLTQIDNS